MPTRSARILGLVRKLIDYGRELYASVLERTADVTAVTRAFGTKDIAAILRRIACGLERANALEARVIREAALLDAGHVRFAPIRSARGLSAMPRPKAPRAAASDPTLALLPTPEEIAAQVRRRPIGAVIADICRDLGILPNHPLWIRLSIVIAQHGGRLTALLKDIMRRIFPVPADAPLAPALPSPAPAGTGPP